MLIFYFQRIIQHKQWNIGWAIYPWRFGWMSTAIHGSLEENWPKLWRDFAIANTRNIYNSTSTIGASKSWTTVCVSTRFIQLKIIHLNNKFTRMVSANILIMRDIVSIFHKHQCQQTSSPLNASQSSLSLPSLNR